MSRQRGFGVGGIQVDFGFREVRDKKEGVEKVLIVIVRSLCFVFWL